MTNEELVAKIQSGNKQYAKDLYLKNLSLVRKIILPYIKNKDEIEDYMQEAFFGLIDAIDRFDASQGVKFMSFAKFYIIRSIQIYKRDSALVKIPLDIQTKIIRYKKAVDALEKSGEQATPKRIFSLTGLSERQQEKIVPLLQNITSLDAPVNAEDESFSLVDTLSAEDNTQQATDDLYKIQIWAAVQENLPERECLVVTENLRYNRSMGEIAQGLNISATRVAQIREQALQRLRRSCKKLLQVYEESEAMIYHDGCNRFKIHQESMVERCAIRDVESEEYLNKERKKIINSNRF